MRRTLWCWREAGSGRVGAAYGRARRNDSWRCHRPEPDLGGGYGGDWLLAHLGQKRAMPCRFVWR
ncbi:hypothetical protein KCP69_06030 [Salmonella enterica subsp. enterica]|nr:hypothetical protein KCP69_06030 [Salmonella enterica subsp. enterica]